MNFQSLNLKKSAFLSEKEKTKLFFGLALWTKVGFDYCF